MQRTILLSAMIIASAIIFNACSSGSAATSPTSSGAPLYAVISAPNGPAITRAALSSARTEAVGTIGAHPQATTPCSGLGTFSGRAGNRLHGYSCTGYFFDIDSVATNSETTAISTMSAGQFLVFDGANCSGNKYVSTNIVLNNIASEDEAVIPNGHVFRYDPNSTGINDASTYYYVPAGATPGPDASIVSAYVFNGFGGGSCQTVTFAAGNGNKLYAVLPEPALVNGTSVTDLPTAAVTGPVVIATN